MFSYTPWVIHMVARWVVKNFWQLNHRPQIAHAFKMHIYSLKEKNHLIVNMEM
jgi:hypothetical protein